MTDWRKGFEDAIEKNRREAQRQGDELQAWTDRNAERRHREAEERHWRRMEAQNRTSPIVAGLAAYGAYKAYKAFTSDDEEKEEKVRKQKWEQIKQNTEAQMQPELAFLDAADELYAAVRESNPTYPPQVAALAEFARAYDAWEDHPRKVSHTDRNGGRP
jgi:hypothetical protein